MHDPYQVIIAQIYQAQQALDQAQQTSGRSYRELYQTTADGRQYLALRQTFTDAYEWPLRRAFANDPHPPIDAAIALLEVAIPARGLCYTRTWLLTRLKRAPLSPVQQQRLRQLALTVCTTRSLGYCRSAFLRLRRLMIRIADPTLMAHLHTLADQPDRRQQTSAQGMLTVILHGRPDLRDG